MGICRLVEQGGHGGYCTARPLGISVRDPLFQGRYHVPLTIPLAPTSVELTVWLAVRLSPASHPSVDDHSSSLWTRAKPADLPRLATRPARTRTHTQLCQTLERRPRGGPHAGLRTWRLRPRLQQLQLPSLGLGSASRSCTYPLSRQRYNLCPTVHSSHLSSTP